MILTWLNYNHTREHIPDYALICDTTSLPPKVKKSDTPHFCPPRCLFNISFDSNPHEQDPYFQNIYEEEISPLGMPRELFGFDSDDDTLQTLLKHHNYSCSIKKLRKQLQDAVLLEFYVLPVYLTSMYSIVEHCNTAAYQAISEVAMQEMLHFVQVANILIAVGGKVKIDGPKHAPSYPKTGLPGGVLPNLHVKIEKFNLRHVYDVMMAIESPQKTRVASKKPIYTLHTIG